MEPVLYSMLMMAFIAVTHGGCETSWSRCDRPPTPSTHTVHPHRPHHPRLFPAGCLVPPPPSHGAPVASSSSGIDRPLAKPHRLRLVTPPWVPDHSQNLSENFGLQLTAVRDAFGGFPAVAFPKWALRVAYLLLICHFQDLSILLNQQLSFLALWFVD